MSEKRGTHFGYEYEEHEVGKDELKFYIEAAEELHYPKSIIDRIKNAKTNFECERVLAYARGNYL